MMNFTSHCTGEMVEKRCNLEGGSEGVVQKLRIFTHNSMVAGMYSAYFTRYSVAKTLHYTWHTIADMDLRRRNLRGVMVGCNVFYKGFCRKDAAPYITFHSSDG